MKTTDVLILVSLLATTSGAHAQNFFQNEEDLKTAIYVLAPPEDREEVKYLLNQSDLSGLNEIEQARLLDITKNGLNKLMSMGRPMLSSDYKTGQK